jgi:hypothetical protein
MSLIDEIKSILDAAGIRHALIGALALSAYGVNRATVDFASVTAVSLLCRHRGTNSSVAIALCGSAKPLTHF